MAAMTRARVVAATRGWSLSTRDTVIWDTPATRATSAMTAGRECASIERAAIRLLRMVSSSIPTQC